MSLSTGEKFGSPFTCGDPKNMILYEIVLCKRTHIILISSLGFLPGEQLILNNSLFCCSLSSNHLEAQIRNDCTESEPMSHH